MKEWLTKWFDVFKIKLISFLLKNLKSIVDKQIGVLDIRIEKMEEKSYVMTEKFDKQYDLILQKQTQNTITTADKISKVNKRMDEFKKLL